MGITLASSSQAQPCQGSGDDDGRGRGEITKVPAVLELILSRMATIYINLLQLSLGCLHEDASCINYQDSGQHRAIMLLATPVPSPAAKLSHT